MDDRGNKKAASAMNEIFCPTCNKPMDNLGNISGMYYTSNPVQWDDVYVCREDKAKKTVRKHGSLPPNYSFVNGYREVK